ncbi:urease accessory protein UreF [Hoyosella sp. G463]|uniref:Urease accessory protein UreF n=1 Tax=Lolliginicoccus lacisalsi TaxID=2742202 RepID=A0A927PMN3_9ACTN|nr:urease accessory UreF family protein [Lolliginicoccus lacisalsi]MBD8506812.1 urease accessory protein UreF [Lolliginicoccus lacisalsi]
MLTDLLALADARLPIGGHVHSGGIEEAITSGLVHDLPTVEAFLVRRIRSTGLTTASITAAVVNGLDPCQADAETDARTPSAAAREASRAQGRGFARLARRAWPGHDWSSIGRRPHLPVITGVVAGLCRLDAQQAALAVIYTTMTSSATAAQRLLALDPADAAIITFGLSRLCDETAREATSGLHALSDPLLDVLAERHIQRGMPLFVS